MHSRSLRSLLALSCVGLLFVAAPGWAEDEEPVVPKPPSLEEMDETEEPVVEIKAGEVKLISTGAEPRRVLRFTPTNGAVYSSATRMKMDMESAMGPMNMPAVVTEMEASVSDVKDNGTFTMTTKIIGARLDGDDPSGMGAMMGQGLGAMKGTTIVATMDSRGKVLSAEVGGSTSPQVGDQLRQTMNSLSVPLPEEAMGVGASWSASYAIKANGLDMIQVSTYTITAFDGSDVHVTMTVKQTNTSKELKTPMGMSIPLKAFSSSGTGKGIIDLQMATARTMTTNINTSMTMEVEGMGAMENKIKIQMTITAKPKAVVTPSHGEAAPDKEKVPATPQPGEGGR